MSTSPLHLLRGGGEQFDPSYLRLNPQAQMPAFADGSAVIIQSMAIIEYLEETHPLPALLPEGSGGAGAGTGAGSGYCLRHSSP